MSSTQKEEVKKIVEAITEEMAMIDSHYLLATSVSGGTISGDIIQKHLESFVASYQAGVRELIRQKFYELEEIPKEFETNQAIIKTRNDIVFLLTPHEGNKE